MLAPEQRNKVRPIIETLLKIEEVNYRSREDVPCNIVSLR